MKNSCYRAVLLGKAIIGSAKDFYDYCSENLTINFKINKDQDKIVSISRREFVYLQPDDTPVTEVKTLEGTRKIHAIKSTGQNLHVETRPLSCYYRNEVCKNSEYVPAWKSRKICLKKNGILVLFKIYYM